jgi:hypothetical protein
MNQLPTGLFHPLQIPQCHQEEIVYDLIVGLLVSEGFNTIFTVVDCFSKMVHYIPTMSTATALNIADLFVTYIWTLHRLLKKIVSNQRPVSNSKCMKQLYKCLDIAPSFSTVYHPQTGVQLECTNQVVEMYLQQFVSHCQEDWASLLPMAEFAYNNCIQASTSKSPFQICYGFSPWLNIE